MNTVLRAFLLFVILLVLALLFGQAGSVPIPVSLQLGDLTATTTAPVAIVVLLAVLLAAFYAGRFTGWLMRLPRKFLNRKRRAVAEVLADAYAALALQDSARAAKIIEEIKQPDIPAHDDLLALLQLHTATLPNARAKDNLTNPRLAPITALALAHGAAKKDDWAEVKRLTTIGRQHAPTNLPLLTLQFKALLNLNEPEAAELLPALKPHLGATRHKLLTQIVQGPTALTARPVLDNAWVKTFQQWLPTDSDTFPA